MHWKEVLEIVSTVLSIIVSGIVIVGGITAHRKGFFRTAGRVLKHHDSKIQDKE